MSTPSLRTLSGSWLTLAFGLLVLLIGTLWYAAMSAYEAAVLRERGRELAAIAELKIDFVRLWLEERRGDAAVQAGRLMLANSLAPRPGSAGAYWPEDVEGQLEAVRKAYNYKAVTLLDRSGAVRLGAGALSDFGRAAAAAAARAVIASGRVGVSRAHHLEDGGRIHVDLDVAAPVADSRQPGAPIVGALTFHLDSRLHLDPLLRGWPAPSGSGEAFLVERTNGEIVYLSSLRHADASLMRRDIGEPSLPAARAARGGLGVGEGLDYRGVPVLTAVGQVPGMPWYVVAKLDREEVLAPVRREARWSGALSALLALALGLAMLFWQQRSRSELARTLTEASAATLRTSEARFRKLHEQGWDFNALFDRGMVIRYASPSIDRYVGRPVMGEAIGVGTARVHPDDVARVEAARRAALAQPGKPQAVVHRLAGCDGGWLTVEACFTNHFDDPDIGALAYTARDISERIHAENRQRESEKRYRYLFELSPDAVFVHRNDIILFANRAAALLFRADSVSALVGRDWHDLVAREEWPKTESRLASLLSGKASFLPPAELHFLALDGQALQVEANAALTVIDGAPAVMSVVRDISERRQAEARRLQQCREQRDMLVREVHHRIKNHLQGLTGLLNQHKRKPLSPATLDAAIAQISAISIIHGLQGREAGGEVRPFMLLREIAAFLGHRAPLEFGNADNPACRNCPWRIVDEESVPVALVINELVTNAIKHRSGPADGRPLPIRIDCACNDEGVVVAVRNPGSLPADFDFTAGTALGTGLTLVRSLLPQTGAGIAFAAREGRVTANLELAPPVLSMPAGRSG